MWGLIGRSKQVSIIVIVTLLVWTLMQGMYAFIGKQPPTALQSASTIASAVGTGLILIANWTWRWVWRVFPQLNRAFFPDLNGLWNGTLQTTWVNPETGLVPGPIEVAVTIRQTLFDISISQHTQESTSYSKKVIAEADRQADRYRLWFDYDNQPKASVSHRSSKHEGVCWLEIHLAEDRNTLFGQYFTDRRTTGDITLYRAHR